MPRSILVRAGVRDPLGPSPAGGFGAVASLAGGIAELQRQYLGQNSIIQTVPYRTVAGAGTPHTGPRDPGTLDEPFAAQRVKMKAHRRRMQFEHSGELGSVDRLVVLTHQLKNSLALPIAPRAVRSPGLVLVRLVHPIRPLIRLARAI